MQVFLPFIDVYETAKVLDPRRFNKQIIECDWILSAIKNPKMRCARHPIVLMYKDYAGFIKAYKNCLVAYRSKDYVLAVQYSELADSLKPEFLNDAQWYFDNFKKRLFTKNKAFYKEFECYGESHTNYYFINNNWKEY
jgi:hypothetical protein